MVSAEHRGMYLVLSLVVVFATSFSFASAVSSSGNYKLYGGQVSPIVNSASSTNYEIQIGGQSISGSAQSSSYTSQGGSAFSESATSGGSIPAAASAGGGVIQEGTVIPAHINAFNVPLEITEEQTGTLSYNFPGEVSIVIDAPQHVAPEGIIITVRAERESSSNEYLLPTDTTLLGKIFWNITATDLDGAEIEQFDDYVIITLTIPEILIGVSDLGIYFLNEDTGEWVLVPGAVFNDGTVTFRVNHLTKFAVFARAELPEILEVVIPIDEDAVGGDTTENFFDFFRGEDGGAIGEVDTSDIIQTVGEERVDLIPEQLFDINLELDDSLIQNIEELVARVIFISFGTVPTPVDLTFRILDKDGVGVHYSKGEVIVETEKVFTKDFSGFALEDGEYTVELVTKYNTSIEDIFVQSFVIGEDVSLLSKLLQSLWFWLILFLVAMLLNRFTRRILGGVNNKQRVL